MSPTRPPIDRDVLAELRRGDERALERLFRERYADLTAEAQSELEADGAAAPRVVEDAFLSAWKSRAQFETPASLEAFLHEHVHMNAVRERSRRASLHRFEAHGRVAHATHAHPVASVDEAWQHVSRILHAPAPTATSAAQAHQAMRHEHAEHVRSIGSSRPWVWPAALAAVLGLVIFGGLRWVDRTSAETAVTKALASPDARAFAARAGQRAAVTLGDGSRATVGAESRLLVPASFGGASMRAVKVEGAASLAVAQATPPLEVRAGAASVMSAGGEVDVSAFGDTAGALVRVRRGSATVRSGADSRTLAAGQAVLVRPDGAMSTPGPAAVDQALAWTGERFVATDLPLRQVLPLMSRWYDVRLEVRDPALLTRRATVNASLASSREAVAQIERTAGVRMQWEGRQMTLHDAGAAAAGPAPAAPRTGR